MPKPRGKDKSLRLALQYRDLLLYEATGGNLGTKPEFEIKNSVATFAEKKALLAEMIKLAEMERKGAENEEEITGLDLIKRNLSHGSGESRGRGDSGGASESDSDGETGTTDSDEA